MWKRECCFLLKEYRKYLKDKNVILVAPAAYLIGRNMGEEIDNYDIVVRINNSLPIPKNWRKIWVVEQIFYIMDYLVVDFK